MAYVEACATFARVAYARGDDALFPAMRRSLDFQWKTWEILNITGTLLRRAADLTGRYRLRGYDSVHPAAVESAFQIFQGHVAFHFAVFDTQLSYAANEAGIPMLEV